MAPKPQTQSTTPQVAEQPDETMSDTDDVELTLSAGDSKLTLEERKKKMEQLRSKMVRLNIFIVIYLY